MLPDTVDPTTAHGTVNEGPPYIIASLISFIILTGLGITSLTAVTFIFSTQL